ncbi:MAG: hypothetical protein D6722_16270 [Bacteroidetes bacterium]|nr:MAG: hypothetical protein D6722_16270 [Bacteroidota bacterium]
MPIIAAMIVRAHRWRRLRRGLGYLLLAGLLGTGLFVWRGPAWLSPHAPLAGAEALIVEGFWGDSLMQAAAGYLAAHPDQKVYVTGGNREVFSGQLPVPGTLRWTFGPQPPDAPQPVVRLKGHSRGCNGQEAFWRVWINDSLLFTGEMPTYQAREWTHILPPGRTSLREIKLELGHPDPDSSCAWVLWYLWAHNMQSAVDQHFTFQPADSSLPAYGIPLPYGEIGRDRLIALGVAPERIVALPAALAADHRTYRAAQGLAAHLETEAQPPRRLNLLGGRYHARRSWEGYRLALADLPAEVGVLRLLPPEPWPWWQEAGQRDSFLKQSEKYLGWCLWRLGAWLGLVS